MMFLDFASHLDMEEADVLNRHLLEYCSMLSFKEEHLENSQEELLAFAEFSWTYKMTEIIANCQKEGITLDFGERLLNLMAKFNHKRNYQVNYD